ncbi:MAG: polyhydroxybutyrate depolymerase [Anaerolineae bacterium]|nr:polyhydroxybutyrate depolymerase [Anaerolineae bacterium]
MRQKWVLLLIFLLMSVISVTAQQEAEYTLRYDQRPRTYILHLPPQYDGETPLPVVFVLHGGGGNPEHTDLVTGFATKGDEEGFITVYPSGTGRLSRQDKLLSWNAGFCCAQALENNVDDIGFLAALIDNLLANYAIDPNRVYMTGLSNGGIMSHFLAGALSDRIAGIAPVEAAAGGQASPNSDLVMATTPDHPVNVLMIHALDDQAVPYYGGQTALDVAGSDFVVISVQQSLDFWLAADDCSPDEAVTTELAPGIATEESYVCQSGAEVALITLTEGGHSWPGSDSQHRIGDTPTQAIDATDVIWAFFASHPKVNEE